MSSKQESLGESIWALLTISRLPLVTINKYKDLTIKWLDDGDPFSSIETLGVSKSTYRAYMRRATSTTKFVWAKRGTDWKLKLFSLVRLKPCPECKTLKDIVEDYSSNQNTCKCCQQKYRDRHKARHREYTKDHYLNNIETYKNRAAQRRAVVEQATPKWADLDKILKIYKTCPEGFEVDHIVPLNGEYVCGLHVEYNLQHLPAEVNRAKSNKLLKEIQNGQ